MASFEGTDLTSKIPKEIHGAERTDQSIGEIVPLERKDVEDAVEIFKQWPEEFSENDLKLAQADFERHFNGHQGDVHYFIMRSSENRIIAVGGYGQEALAPDVYYIGYFAVDKNLQRKGIGGALLERIETELKERGKRMIIIRTWDRGPDDPKALFYTKHGYKPSGLVPEYWDDWADLLFYTKRLQLSLRQQEKKE